MAENSNQFNETLVQNLLDDRKRDRRWRNIRFFAYVIIFILVVWGLMPKHHSQTIPTDPYVSLVKMNGPIMPGQSFSANKVVPQLRKAFADNDAKGVVLLINSPGGSAVQASIIHDLIIHLKHKYHKKVVVVAEDMLASGAYLVASAADKIYVNRDTITGSIGVIMEGFGFTDTLKKLGMTRRVYTAGANKDRLDPFRPVSKGDIAKIKTLLAEAHKNFIRDVREGRGKKLQASDKDLFSGDFWLGQQAVHLGLADGTGNLWSVMKHEFNVAHYKDYSTKPSLLKMLVKGAAVDLHLPGLGANLANPGIQATLSH